MKRGKINNAKSFNKEMKRIIRLVRDNKPIGKLSDESIECLGTCIQDGYIIGVELERNAAGNLVGGINNPKATNKGLCFIAPRIDWHKIATLVMSGIALLISFAAAHDKIFAFVKMIFNLE